MKRRLFLQSVGALYANARVAGLERGDKTPLPNAGYSPGRIPNEYSLLLPGERQALATEPSIDHIEANAVAARVGKQQQSIKPGELIDGWQLKAIAQMNGTATAVFEKHVTHQGAIVFVTKSEGVILRVPKRIGSLATFVLAPPALLMASVSRGESLTSPGPTNLAITFSIRTKIPAMKMWRRSERNT